MSQYINSSVLRPCNLPKIIVKGDGQPGHINLLSPISYMSPVTALRFGRVAAGVDDFVVGGRRDVE